MKARAGGVSVRPAEAGDATGIAAMLREIAEQHHRGRPDVFRSGTAKYGAPECLELIADPDRPAYVAVGEGGELLGYCLCEVQRSNGHPVLADRTVLYIDDFFVRREARGRGVGRALAEAARARARELGAAGVELNVWAFNSGAVAFYERMGFRVQRLRLEAEP